MTMTDTIANILILGIMTVGLLGLLIPVIPGLVIIWLASLAYGIGVGFQTPGWIFFSILSVIMVVGSVVDNLVMGQQAHKTGASWISVLLAMLFGVIGTFILPIIGGFIGALAALFLAEWIRRKNWREAMTATTGWAVGCGWAIVIRFILGLLMIGIWIIWVLV
jgi:uncharacterized protein YqgC (DUF456 family)